MSTAISASSSQLAAYQNTAASSVARSNETQATQKPAATTRNEASQPQASTKVSISAEASARLASEAADRNQAAQVVQKPQEATSVSAISGNTNVRSSAAINAYSSQQAA